MSNIQRFGSYYLLKKIATGGMAELYKAKKSGEKGFEKLLAIKMILPHLSANDEFISMFIDEAKVAALLNHQDIVQIYDLGKIEDAYCIVMEYVRGKDLKTVLSRGAKSRSRLSPEHACLITVSALAGLSYAHRKKDKGRDLKIVHRDISPQNILVSYEGEVKIVDFGIAKAATQSRDTKVGVLKGKIAYMSPEQAMGKALDHRSDIFSIGIVLYEMLTGRKLFHGDTDLTTLEQVRAAKVEPLPHELNKAVPRELEEILLKSLKKEPEGRFQTAAEMEEALQQFMRRAGFSTGSYSLSQYMYQLFKDDIEEEIREEEEWDHTIVTEALSADTIVTVSGQGAEKAPPARETPARAASPAGKIQSVSGRPSFSEKKGWSPLQKALLAVIAVVAVAIFGLWIKLRPAGTDSQPPVEQAVQTVPAAEAPPQASQAAVPQPEETKPVKDADEAGRPPVNAAKPPAQRPQTPLPPAAASVTITSDPPGAEAFVDGRSAGVTPFSLMDVKPGQPHKVRLSKDGYEPWSGSFTAGQGESASVHGSLAELTAAISVASSPGGARVVLDGQDTGRRTPATIDGLKPGKPYRVKVSLDGYASFETTAAPETGRAASVNAALVQLFGSLTVDARPWAVVFVDGEEKGMTPLAGMKLAVGEHEMVLGNPKLMVKKRIKVRILPDKTTRIVIDLNKETSR